MEELHGILHGLAYVVLGFVLLYVARLFRGLVSPYPLQDQLTEADNPAAGLAFVGYFIGVIIIYLGAAVGGRSNAEPPPDHFAREAHVVEPAGAVGLDPRRQYRFFPGAGREIESLELLHHRAGIVYRQVGVQRGVARGRARTGQIADSQYSGAEHRECGHSPAKRQTLVESSELTYKFVWLSFRVHSIDRLERSSH